MLQDIRTRFSNGNTSTGQDSSVGLGRWFDPCPAAITVLLLCLPGEGKSRWSGTGVVLQYWFGNSRCVSVGARAAFGARQASNRLALAQHGCTPRSLFFQRTDSSVPVGVLYRLFHGWTGLNA